MRILNKGLSLVLDVSGLALVGANWAITQSPQVSNGSHKTIHQNTRALVKVKPSEKVLVREVLVTLVSLLVTLLISPPVTLPSNSYF